MDNNTYLVLFQSPVLAIQHIMHAKVIGVVRDAGNIWYIVKAGKFYGKALPSTLEQRLQSKNPAIDYVCKDVLILGDMQGNEPVTLETIARILGIPLTMISNNP